MNLLTKKTPWLVATLFATASVFGQQGGRPQQKSYEQGHELNQMQMMSGYNAPARIDVRGSWDVYAAGSFTYWQPLQDNMELGIITNTSNPANFLDGNVLNMDFDYKPGFQVELGVNFDHDNWDARAMYSWFRGTQSTSSRQPQSGTTVIAPMLGHPGINNSGTTYFNASGNWKLHMDLLDVVLERAYYVGTKLTFCPYFGARAAWIRQNRTANYNDGTLTTTPLDSSQKTHSWGVGAEGGINCNWMLGEGLRFYGNGMGDIIFTRYSSASTRDAGSSQATTVIVKQNNINTLRTHLAMELGLGWGSYFDNNNWHIDLAAGYGFQVFFNQNMFRHFEDVTSQATSTMPNGDLYLHGLTATVRFDF